MLFFNLPVQLAPPRNAKEANRRSPPPSNPNAPAPRRVDDKRGASVPMSRIAPRHRDKVAGSVFASDFIGPLDLRPVMVKRFKTGSADNVDYLRSKKARAIALGEAHRELCNEPITQRVGLADMARSNPTWNGEP